LNYTRIAQHYRELIIPANRALAGALYRVWQEVVA